MNLAIGQNVTESQPKTLPKLHILLLNLKPLFKSNFHSSLRSATAHLALDLELPFSHSATASGGSQLEGPRSVTELP